MSTGEQHKNSKVPPQLQPHVYKKGQSGNPSGRPKGAISMKEYVKRKLQSMTPEEREEYLEGIDKKIIWEMAEGKAQQNVEAKVTLPKPLLDHVYNHNSDEETDNSEQEN